MLPAALLAAGLMLTVAPPSPSTPVPSPSPLQEIGRVRSRALCTTLRENVAPTLAKLIEGDQRIAGGRTTFVQMGRHQVLKERDRMEFDRIALGNAVTTLARTIGAADTLLADKRRFPASPATDDERDAAAMKAQLQAVIAEQKSALNLLGGIYETELLGQMQHDLPVTVKNATAPVGATPAPEDDGVTYIDTAGVNNGATVPGTTVDLRTAQRGLFGRTLFDTSAAALASSQKKIATVETFAAGTVMAALADCRRAP